MKSMISEGDLKKETWSLMMEISITVNVNLCFLKSILFLTISSQNEKWEIKHLKNPNIE